MKKPRSALVLGVTLAVLAVPVIAQAALPRTSNTLIVPAHSLGGVTLGSNAKAVTKAWGKNGACEEFRCLYEGAAPAGGTASVASVLLETPGSGGAPKVTTVFVNIGDKRVGSELKPNFVTPLTRFKTSKGIGLGSTATELKHAYKGLKKEGTAGLFTYALKGPKESETDFSTVSGRVTGIAVRSHPGG